MKILSRVFISYLFFGSFCAIYSTGLLLLYFSGLYDHNTQKSVQEFQQKHQLTRRDGTLDVETAITVVRLHMADKYRTDPIPADCKFFVKLVVRSDRTIETNATLYSCGKNAKPLHTFLVRARGGTTTKG